MKTKLLPGLLVLLLFTGCKKDKKAAPVIYSVSGDTFALSSYQTNFGAGVNAAVNQYPCMAYNTLTFYRDSTSSSSYYGLDSCFITPTHLQSAGAQVYGLPGTLPLPSTWSQKGNNIYVLYPGNPKPVQGVVTNVNGSLQIDFKDTVESGAKTYYINSLEVQQ
jgi:hypothetical protein